MLGSQDKSLKIDNRDIRFPVLPFSLAPYLVNLIVFRRYPRAWRFSPSTFHGELRGTEWFTLSANLECKKRGKWPVFLIGLLLTTTLVMLFLRFSKGESFELTGKWFSRLLAVAGEGFKGSLL